MKAIAVLFLVVSTFGTAAFASDYDYDSDSDYAADSDYASSYDYEEGYLEQTPSPTPPAPAGAPTSVCVVATRRQNFFHGAKAAGATATVTEGTCSAVGAPAKKACFMGAKGAARANAKAKHYYAVHCADKDGVPHAGFAPYVAPAVDKPACSCTCPDDASAVKDTNGDILVCLGGPDLIK